MNSKFVAKDVKSSSSYLFNKDISNLIIKGDMLNTELSMKNLLPEKVMIEFNVLGLGMLNQNC